MKIYRRWAAAVAVAAAVAAVPFQSFGEVLNYDWDSAYEDWEEGADDGEDTSGDWGEDDPDNGPGIVTDQAGTGSAGTGLQKSTITERYHEEYGIYEESIGGIFFFYSNVGNGGITDEPVTLDIPANLIYKVEKDGLPYAYTAGGQIAGKGTYVVKLSGVDDVTLPLSEQKEYQAIFRFRIQEKLPGKGDEALEAAAGAVSGLTGAGGSLFPQGVGDVGESKGLEDESQAAESQAVEGPEDESQAESAMGTGRPGEDDPGEEGTQEGLERDPAMETGEGSSPEAPAPVRSQEYDRGLRKYLVTLENGKSLVSSIPEGLTASAPVEVTVSEEDTGETELYLNDQSVEYVRGNSLVEPGSYRLVLGGESYFFTIASAVSAMDYYPAPVGMAFTEAYLDEQPLDLPSGLYAAMEEDGTYKFVLEGEKGDRQEVTLRKDTTAPRIEVTTKGGAAAIQYKSEDIAKVTLQKAGEEAETFNGNSVDKPGTYRLTAWDEAGNQASVEFTLKYQVNTYGVVAVILIILVAVGVCVFIIHIKKTIKVR